MCVGGKGRAPEKRPAVGRGGARVGALVPGQPGWLSLAGLQAGWPARHAGERATTHAQVKSLCAYNEGIGITYGGGRRR